MSRSSVNCSFLHCLVRDLFSIVPMHVYISLTFDVSLFALDRIGDLLGVLELFLANRHLTRLDRLLRRRHLFLADWNAVGLTLADRRIGWLARARTALDVHLLTSDWHIYRLCSLTTSLHKRASPVSTGCFWTFSCSSLMHDVVQGMLRTKNAIKKKFVSSSHR